MKKIALFLVNLISLLIPFREARHGFKRTLRQFVRDCSISEAFRLRRFLRHTVAPHTVLIVETNNCHGEVVAGFAKYFRDLGFNLEIVVNEAIFREKPFARCQFANTTIESFVFSRIAKIFRDFDLRAYEHVFVTSSAAYIHASTKRNIPAPSVAKLFPALAEHPSSFLVEHDLNDIANFNEEEWLAKNHLITLGKFAKGVAVNSHYFGEVRVTPKNAKTTFIVVGLIDSVRKNHAMLLQAIEKLDRENREFSVVVVGHGKLDALSPAVRKHVRITGRLNFPDMYRELENADFLLTLLDENNPDHERYITSGVTGSAQLIYGFAKIPIIHEKFANFYGFAKNNAIVHGNDELFFAMNEAIEMSASEYATRQENLTKLANDIAAKSRENLKEVLK